MSKLIDLTGQKFGCWTVLSRAKNSLQGHSRWLCECDCGTQRVVLGNSLRRGESTNCGCVAKEKLRKINTKHNKKRHPLYSVWIGMKKRCLNKNDHAYMYYGGRGVTIHNEWINHFQSFYNWAIKNGYKRNLTLDRIDVNGNYEPSNCRWTDKKTQARNRRSNFNITYNNETKCLTEWSEILGINRGTLKSRILRSKWSIEKAFTTPIKTKT